MDRRKIENVTASLAVILLFIMTFRGILFMGDLFFDWDLFTQNVEKIIGFFLVLALVIIISSVLVNIMIDISIISINTDMYIEKLLKNLHEKQKDS